MKLAQNLINHLQVTENSSKTEKAFFVELGGIAHENP